MLVTDADRTVRKAATELRFTRIANHLVANRAKELQMRRPERHRASRRGERVAIPQRMSPRRRGNYIDGRRSRRHMTGSSPSIHRRNADRELVFVADSIVPLDRLCILPTELLRRDA